MSNIDWSKAPEWATHYLPADAKRSWDACWYKQDSLGQWFGLNAGNYDRGIYDEWTVDNDQVEAFTAALIQRPVPQWSGMIKRSNDEVAVEVAKKVIYRFGNLFWAENIRRKDLVGKIAGSVSPTDGYRYVKCGKSRRPVAVHRVVFLMHHGYLPEVIDHINRIRDDNRIENLRDAITEGNNQANQSHQEGRSSKYKGVCWDEARGKWSAYTKKDGMRFNLGRFESEDDAAMAYNAKAILLFGEFANLNVISTPSQIAAEEREAAIAHMCEITEERITLRAAGKLYDAGLRLTKGDAK